MSEISKNMKTEKTLNQKIAAGKFRTNNSRLVLSHHVDVIVVLQNQSRRGDRMKSSGERGEQVADDVLGCFVGVR